MTAETNAPDPTAVLVRRVVAHLIDSAVYAAAALIPIALLVDSRALEPGEVADRLSQAPNGDLITYKGTTVYTLTDTNQYIAIGAALAAFVLIAVLMQGLTGRTIGKFITGIRTVKADGDRPGIFRALVRSLLWIIDGIPSFVLPLIGGGLALVTSGRRRLGDLVARTYVVHRKFAGEPIVHPDDAPATEPDNGTTIDDHPGHVTITGADEPLTDDAAVAVADDREASEAAWAAAEEENAAPDEQPGGETDGEPATPTTKGDAPSEPKWDKARKAYISYDPRRGGWVQHDTETDTWIPISRA